jgi:hypothetical protein
MFTLLSSGSGIVVCLCSCCLAMSMFTEPFPTNCCLCWLPNSGYQQTWHNNNNYRNDLCVEVMRLKMLKLNIFLAHMCVCARSCVHACEIDKLKLKLNYYWQLVGLSVLVSGTHLGPAINFSFSLKFSLDNCVFVILQRPLWREDRCVIYCYCWSSPAQSRGTRRYFIVPILETPPTWRARSPYLYPPGTGWPRYTPGHRIPFMSPLMTCRATVEVFYPAATGDR